MSPGGTDVSLLELVAGFFVAAALIAVITLILRRRGGHQDLLGAQVRELQARADAAAAPGADTRLRDAATRVADARRAPTPAPDPASTAPAPHPASAAPAPHPASTAAEAASDALSGDASAAQTGPRGAAFPDATTPPPATSGANDAMADAFAWLRIAALVEAGQRDQAVALLSTAMAISTDEAGMLVDGLTDTGGERHPG